ERVTVEMGLDQGADREVVLLRLGERWPGGFFLCGHPLGVASVGLLLRCEQLLVGFALSDPRLCRLDGIRCVVAVEAPITLSAAASFRRAVCSSASFLETAIARTLPQSRWTWTRPLRRRRAASSLASRSAPGGRAWDSGVPP